MIYTEDPFVQQTTAEYLEQALGWESVYPYNIEDFGPNSLLDRESEREVVLTRILRTKIEELNPGLPASAYDDAAWRIPRRPDRGVDFGGDVMGQIKRTGTV